MEKTAVCAYCGNKGTVKSVLEAGDDVSVRHVQDGFYFHRICYARSFGDGTIYDIIYLGKYH